MRNLTGRILFILIIISATILELSKLHCSIYSDSFMHVELRGYLPYDQSIELNKGSVFKDLLEKAELYEDSDISILSLDYPLYNGQIIEFKKQDNNLININLADKNQLMLLPGIGEKTADKIIEYRKSVPFHCKEDLMKINGIGEKKYELLKELISV